MKEHGDKHGPTPRCDKEKAALIDAGCDLTYPASCILKLARDLERELAEFKLNSERAIGALVSAPSSIGATGEADRAHNAIGNLGRAWVDRYNEMYRIAQNLDTALKSQIKITNTERATKERLEASARSAIRERSFTDQLIEADGRRYAWLREQQGALGEDFGALVAEAALALGVPADIVDTGNIERIIDNAILRRADDGAEKP